MIPNRILRLVALVLIALIVLLFFVWNAGLVSLPLLPTPTPGTEGPQPPFPESGAITTEPIGSDTPPTTSTPETPPSTSAPNTDPPSTNPPVTQPEMSFPDAAQLITAGASLIQTGDYTPSRTLLARVELTEALSALPITQGTRKHAKIVRVETQTAGIAIQTQNVDLPILSLEPYMGYLIAHTPESDLLLSNSGELIREHLPAFTPVYDRDDQGRPIVLLPDGYHAITGTGMLTAVSYQPPQYDVRTDTPSAPTRTYPKPFSAVVPIFREVTEEDMEDYPAGTVFYTEQQKDAILNGMSPEDALVQFPLNPPTEEEPDIPVEPDVTEPSDTVAPEDVTEPENTEPQTGEIPLSMTDAVTAEPEGTQIEDTVPEDTQPEDTQPEDTQPEDTQPEDTQPEDTQPEDTQPEDTQPEDTQPEDTQPEDTQPEDTEPEPEPEPEPITLYHLSYEERYGYRDASGNVVIAPTYLYAFPFGENGLAAATRWCETVKAETLLFLNTSGRTVIDVAGKLHWYYTVNRNSVYDGYYPTLTTDTSAQGSYFFEDGYVMVRRRMVIWDRLTYAYSDEEILIDESGEIFPIPEGYSLRGYSNGILILEKNNRYGCMNTHGQWVVQPIYDEIRPFSQGLAPIKQGGVWGMIDTEGNFVLPLVFDALSHISQGTITASHPTEGWMLLQLLSAEE